MFHVKPMSNLLDQGLYNYASVGYVWMACNLERQTASFLIERHADDFCSCSFLCTAWTEAGEPTIFEQRHIKRITSLCRVCFKCVSMCAMQCLLRDRWNKAERLRSASRECTDRCVREVHFIGDIQFVRLWVNYLVRPHPD